MKTCEEMAQSVIHRAKAHRAVMKRRILTVTASVLCICCIGLGAFVMIGPAPAEPVPHLQQTIPTNTPEPVTQPQQTVPTNTTVPEDTPIVEDPPVVPNTSRITFLSANSNDTVELYKDVKLPLHMEMRAKDLRGLTKEEQEAIIQAEKAYAESVIRSYPGINGYNGQGYQWSQYSMTNTVVTTIVAGHIIIGVDDLFSIESIYLETGGAIQLCYVNALEEDEDLYDEWRYFVDGTDLSGCYFSNGGIAISWMPDGFDLSALDEDPPIDLSKFSDTITVVATFKDGVVEKHQIDIVITEDGQTSAIYRGQPTQM